MYIFFWLNTLHKRKVLCHIRKTVVSRNDNLQALLLGCFLQSLAKLGQKPILAIYIWEKSLDRPKRTKFWESNMQTVEEYKQFLLADSVLNINRVRSPICRCIIILSVCCHFSKPGRNWSYTSQCLFFMQHKNGVWYSVWNWFPPQSARKLSYCVGRFIRNEVRGSSLFLTGIT